ncbi:arylsulfatase [Haloferula sp. BvORR071]|uniref:arylsulfatase n=1 Tax=Haloferula sp. BvORR071 TaxID=1396141 RepID=UPI000697B17C|nr:arylsulfatase [Haloferula sp. BvORR071]
MLRVSALAAIANLFFLVLLHAADTPPNVIVVITDDQGYGDFSFSGNPQVKTPALDKFRGESAAFEHFQVSPTCAPTRAALLTGLHEFRCGISHTFMGRSLLKPGLPTLPEMFRASGYRTGIFGKWHLGDAYPCRPEDRGFDEVFVHGGGGIGQTPDYWGNTYNDPMVRRRGGWEKTHGYCTDVFFDEAIGWMKKQANLKQPFLLHLATNAPHAPYTPPPGGPDKMPDAFYAMIGNIDGNFAKLLAAVDEAGIAQDTIIVFLTDNGSAVGEFSAGMKGKKGSADEGGTHVPCFVRWPGKIAPRKVEELAAHLDLLPTLTTLCGVKRPADWKGDGLDLSAALLGKGEFPKDRTLITQVGRWPGDDAAARFRARDFAVRDNRWRLVGLELFDMQADPGQTKNVFTDNPAEAQRLLGIYGKWWEEVLPIVREPVRQVIGAEACPLVKLTAHDWWPSKETDGSGAEACVTHAQIRDFLKAAQVAATRNTLPSTTGHWKLEVARQGNYELIFGLLPPEATPEERTALAKLHKGLAHVRAGQEELRVEIKEGATQFRLPIDLEAGPADLEIWFDGQLLNDRLLGAFFASAEYKGERKTPKIEIKPKTVPKK